MTIKTIQNTENNVNQLIEEVSISHQPILITGSKIYKYFSYLLPLPLILFQQLLSMYSHYE